MPSAPAWNGGAVTVPRMARDPLQRACGRDQTIVAVHGEHASTATSIEHVLANAIAAAVGDPEALVLVGPAFVTVVQWHGGVEAAWRAETPEEWADFMESSPPDGEEIQGGALDDAMSMGLLDNVLDWREGWPPETEDDVA